MRFFLVVSMLMVTFFTWGLGLEEGFLRGAKKSFTSGNYSEALKYFNTLLKIKKDRKDILLEYGISLGKTGSFEKAVKVLTELKDNDIARQYIPIFNAKQKVQVELKDATPEKRAQLFQDYLQSGNQFFQRGEYQKAILQYTLADEFTGKIKPFSLYYSLAEANYYMGNYTEAMDSARRAGESALKSGGIAGANLKGQYDALILQGRIAMGQKKPDFVLAEDVLKKAHKIQSFRPEYECGMGVLYYKKNELAKAMGFFAKAISKSPQYMEPYMGLADIFIFQRKFLEAETVLKEVIRKNSNTSRALDKLGELYLVWGKMEDAKSCFRSAYNQSPNPEYYAHMCKAIVKTNNNFIGAPIILKGIEMYPENTEILLAYGMYLELILRTREASDTYKKILYFDPAHQDALYNLGCNYFGRSAIHPDSYCLSTPEKYGLIFNLKKAEELFETLLYLNKSYIQKDRVEDMLKKIKSKIASDRASADERAEENRLYMERLIEESNNK